MCGVRDHSSLDNLLVDENIPLDGGQLDSRKMDLHSAVGFARLGIVVRPGYDVEKKPWSEQQFTALERTEYDRNPVLVPSRL